MLTECTRLPLAAVIVSVEVPLGADGELATENVDDPEPLTEVGAKLPVAPPGRPETLNVTVPANPFRPVIVAV
jgi:hypothetical protein